MSTTPTKNEELAGQSQLVRVVAATLEIKSPDKTEIKFRGALLRKATAEMTTIKPAFLVRLFEAACGVDFPDSEVVAFRIACERSLAGTLDLAAYRLTRPVQES